MNDRDDPSTNRIPDDAQVSPSNDASRIEALERELRESREKLDRLEREIGVLRRTSASTVVSVPTQKTPFGAGLAVGLAVLILGVGVVALFVVRKHDAPLSSSPSDDGPPRVAPAAPVVISGSDASNPSGGGVVPPGEHLQWGIGFGPSVAPIAINDDGIEDFVGAYRLVGEDVYIGAFDGKTLQRIWKRLPSARSANRSRRPTLLW